MLKLTYQLLSEAESCYSYGCIYESGETRSLEYQTMSLSKKQLKAAGIKPGVALTVTIREKEQNDDK